jgi:branched-chain amino acid transport system substrate-binding protein
VHTLKPAFLYAAASAALVWLSTCSQAHAQWVIGQVLPMEGPTASSTKPVAEGAAAYVAAVNKRGGLAGKPIELVTRNDNFNPDITLKEVSTLLADRKPVAFINTTGAPNLGKLISTGVLKNAGVPMVGGFTGSTVVRAGKDSMVFYIDGGLDLEAFKMVEQVGALGVKRVGVFYQNDGFGKDGLAQIKRYAAQFGVEVAAEGAYERTTADAAEAAQKILTKGVQAVLMFTSGAAASDFLKRYRAGGGGAMLIASSSCAADVVYKNLGERARGLGLMQLAPPVQSSARIAREFREALKDYAPNSQPTPLGLKGFIAAKTVVEAIRLSGREPSPAAVLKGLVAMNRHDIGNMELTFTGGQREGSRFREIGVLAADGRILN